MEEITTEELAASYAAKAERALKILKITVIITAVCAVVLPAISLVLLMALENKTYGFVGLIISLGVFVAMLAALVAVIFFVRGQVKKLKSLDKEDESKNSQIGENL